MAEKFAKRLHTDAGLAAWRNRFKHGPHLDVPAASTRQTGRCPQANRPDDPEHVGALLQAVRQQAKGGRAFLAFFDQFEVVKLVSLIPPSPWQELVESLHDEASGAVFAEAADLVGLEHAEGLGGVVGALHVGGVEDVAQLVAGQTVGASRGVMLAAADRVSVK